MSLKRDNKENAVSPVVGVMLMLVVTIIIAAVVAAFASGLFTSSSVAPQTVFSVDYHATTASNGYDPSGYITWTHDGGDTLDPNGFEIILEEYGQTWTRTFKDESVSISSSGGVSTGSKIIFDGSKDTIYLYGQTTWSILDVNSGNKIASGSFYLS